MAQSVKITVRPPSAHPDSLTVQDAMLQIAEAFDLLGQASDDPRVLWRLVNVSMSSPMTAEAEPFSLEPDFDYRSIADSQISAFESFLAEAVTGHIPEQIPEGWDKRRVLSFLDRNTNGIGLTEIVFESRPEPLILSPQRAGEAAEAFRRAEAVSVLEWPDRPRKERGSIEGVLHEVGFHYNTPAVQILDSRSGRPIWCRVSEGLDRRISDQASFEDVWQGARVRVRGWIHRVASGDISWVEAEALTRIAPPGRKHTELRDETFTGGLSPAEYLNKLREGELG